MHRDTTERTIAVHGEGRPLKAIAAETGLPLCRCWKTLAVAGLTRNSATLRQRAATGMPEDVVERLKKVGSASAKKLAAAIERDRTKRSAPATRSSRKVGVSKAEPAALKRARTTDEVRAAAQSA